MSSSSATVGFAFIACSLIAACGAGSDPSTQSGAEASTVSAPDYAIDESTPEQAPSLAAGTPEIDPAPIDIQPPTGAINISDSTEEPDVEIGSSEGTDADVSAETNTDADATAGEDTESASPTIPIVTTFDVTLVSVDVRRAHDGERIDVNVDDVGSGPLRWNRSQ